MKVTIYAHGKMSEKFYGDACAAYEKRLTTLWPLTVIEAPEARLAQDPSPGEIAAALSAEAKAALAKIPRRAYVIALCIEGKMLMSIPHAMVRFSTILYTRGFSLRLSGRAPEACLPWRCC